jgi:hypothetical protein
MAFWGHRASRHQVAGDAGWRHLLSGSEGNALDCVRSRFERALLELDRDRSGRQTGSGAYRVGTAGGIGGGGVGVPFPSSMSIQFPQIQLQFHSFNWDPIPQFKFQIGTHTAISIPHWGPNINDWVPAIGWGLSIVGAIIFGRNTNTMADLLVTRNASGLFNAFVNGHFAFSVMDTDGVTRFSGPDNIIYFFMDDFQTLLNFPPEAGSGFVDRIQVTTPVPGPIAGAGLPGLSWRAVAFSAGGDGGRRSPELPIRTRRLRQPAIAEQSRFMSTRPGALKSHGPSNCLNDGN